MKRFSGKGLERRMRKLHFQPKPAEVLFQWIREGRITPNDLSVILDTLRYFK